MVRIRADEDGAILRDPGKSIHVTETMAWSVEKIE
jgi:hypothetical protein